MVIRPSLSDIKLTRAAGIMSKPATAPAKEKEAPSVTVSAQELGERNVRVASRYTGLREIRPNQDWDKPSTPGRDSELAESLRAIMRPSPWEPGWAYCLAAAEGWVAVAMQEAGMPAELVKRFRDVITPHCVTTARVLAKLDLLESYAVPGAIWLTQRGKSSNGHAGLVVAVKGATMATIEANTSLDPSTPSKEREGDWITNRVRSVMRNGEFSTLGFLHPQGMLDLAAGVIAAAA
ncbi:MAG: hypothetical protein AB7I98_04000 [Verrucomicrobiales bacterium]